jgi:hypothetical protein
MPPQVCGKKFTATKIDQKASILCCIYNFTALPSRFLTLRIIFDFKTSFKKIMPFVNKKAYVLEF